MHPTALSWSSSHLVWRRRRKFRYFHARNPFRKAFFVQANQIKIACGAFCLRKKVNTKPGVGAKLGFGFGIPAPPPQQLCKSKLCRTPPLWFPLEFSSIFAPSSQFSKMEISKRTICQSYYMVVPKQNFRNRSKTYYMPIVLYGRPPLYQVLSTRTLTTAILWLWGMLKTSRNGFFIFCLVF